MIEPIKATVPKSPVPGMNTKTLGRVKPVTEYKQPVEKVAVEKVSIEKHAAEKTAAEGSPYAKTSYGYAIKTMQGNHGGALHVYNQSNRKAISKDLVTYGHDNLGNKLGLRRDDSVVMYEDAKGNPMNKVLGKNQADFQEWYIPHVSGMRPEVAEDEKTAAFVGPVAKGALSAGVVSAIKAAGGVAGLAIGTKVVSAVADAVHAPKYKATLEKAVQLNPRLASYPPDRLWDYYQVMISASPNIASNPLIVSNYLEYLIDHEGRLNFTAYDTLSKVEGQGISNRNNAYPLMNSAMKGLIDGAVKYTFDTYKNEKRENEAYAKGKADAYLENQYGLFGQEG